jgi:hypothetical protein
MTHDIHADATQDEAIVAMHADAERFDPRTEEVFKILQVTRGQQLPGMNSALPQQAVCLVTAHAQLLAARTTVWCAMQRSI